MRSDQEPTHSLPIQGNATTRVILDGRFILVFEAEGASGLGYELAIETTLEWWVGSDSEKTSVDPQDGSEDASLLGQAVSALHKLCTSATADPNGTLLLAFDNDLRIQVRPDDRYEAWTLVAIKQPGFRMVAPPGGGITVWT